MISPCGGKAVYFSREHGRLEPHPSSVNAGGHASWSHRWVVYFDKVQTEGGLFVYDSTEIGPLPVLLFGAGDVQNGGKLLPCTIGGAPLDQEQAEVARVELEALRRQQQTMAAGADRELLCDRIQQLERRLGSHRRPAEGTTGIDALGFVVGRLKIVLL